MAFEPRDNSGILSRNDRKEKPNHPDHRGQCVVDGKPYWISAWVKENQYGKYFSISFTPKEAKSGDKPPTTPSEDISDDVPF